MHKRFASLILVSFLVVSAIVLTLAYRANVELERVVSAQFNEQQLLLARKIAQDISHDFELLNEALLHFSRSTFLAPETNADETSAIGDLLGFLKDFGVLGLGFSASGGPSAVLTDEGWTTLDELGVHLPEQEDGKAPGSFSPNVVLSRTQRSTHGPFADRWVMTMVAPMQDKGSQGLSGTDCLFVLDAQSIARSAAEGVRSGKTGYAWVIDGQGHFMYHVEAEFVGQDAFTARHKRNPDLSYKRINSLMSERLLKGEEGTDWYVSGWHWDMIREMKKLFAFSPVIFSRNGTGPVHVWSVGLAAPDSEVYGLIQPVVLRQGAVVGIFGISALLGFAAFLFLSLHWSQSLRAEVARKTEYLQRSEDELRRERDKVSRSMEELLETQEKLMISERFAAIGEAAAHLSHEIKNPLMVMGGFAGQILRTLPEDDPRREKLKIIADEANRLEHLLTEVRDFTRPPRPQPRETDLNGLVGEVLRMFEAQAAEQGIVCRMDSAEDIPVCRIDSNQIKQVLINLVKNAVEAMPDGGSLKVTTARDGQHLKVTVENSGEGIPPEVMKRIFHPFFSTKAKGTGLGLAVSYKLVQDHGGEIVVQNYEGQGARFTVSLPLEAKTD